jgi:hypothetical protein
MFLIGAEGVPIFSGLDLESLIIIVSSILAVALFIISLLAYWRDKRIRLLFVTGAFFLFAIKGFLVVIGDNPGESWIDTGAPLLDFGILLLFFLGLIKK